MQQPFVIKCLSEECTVLHAGRMQILDGELDTEINSGSEFGKKLKRIRDKVANL